MLYALLPIISHFYKRSVQFPNLMSHNDLLLLIGVQLKSCPDRCLSRDSRRRKRLELLQQEVVFLVVGRLELPTC